MTHRMMKSAAALLAVVATGCDMASTQQGVLNGLVEVFGSTLVTWLLSYLLPV